MGTVSKNRGMSCVGVRKTGTTLIRVSTVMGTLYNAIVNKKCISCSAPLIGKKGQVVHCKYCDTDQIL